MSYFFHHPCRCRGRPTNSDTLSILQHFRLYILRPLHQISPGIHFTTSSEQLLSVRTLFATDKDDNIMFLCELSQLRYTIGHFPADRIVHHHLCPAFLF